MKRKGRALTVMAAIGVVTVTVVLALHRDRLAARVRFFWLFESIGANEQGYREYRHRQTGIVLVRLPGGRFLMGAQSDDPEAPNYDPDTQQAGEDVHEVTLSPFLIGKYEVTQAQWEAVMQSRPSDFVGDRRPVESVSWDELRAAGGFLERTGLRLPTEAQWEFACRAGQEGPYSGTGRLDDMGWYDANSAGTTHPVGMKRPNQFGVHDRHGNVLEWCDSAAPCMILIAKKVRRPYLITTAGIEEIEALIALLEECRRIERSLRKTDHASHAIMRLPRRARGGAVKRLEHARRNHQQTMRRQELAGEAWKDMLEARRVRRDVLDRALPSGRVAGIRFVAGFKGTDSLPLFLLPYREAWEQAVKDSAYLQAVNLIEKKSRYNEKARRIVEAAEERLDQYAAVSRAVDDATSRVAAVRGDVAVMVRQFHGRLKPNEGEERLAQFVEAILGLDWRTENLVEGRKHLRELLGNDGPRRETTCDHA